MNNAQYANIIMVRCFIGEGKGENLFCALFYHSPLCISRYRGIYKKSFVVKYFFEICYTTDFRAIGPKVLCAIGDLRYGTKICRTKLRSLYLEQILTSQSSVKNNNFSLHFVIHKNDMPDYILLHKTQFGDYY